MPASDQSHIDQQFAEAKRLLAGLVSFDTTSHRSNLELIDFVESYLAEHGVEAERVPSADGNKTNLFATIGPKGVPGIALSGHTDVVPAEPENWDTHPFELHSAGGKLYGRGTSDMKGFVACVLAAVPSFSGRKLKTPIHLAFSYDEEIGCIGVRPMIAEFGQRFIRPRMVIVGEPTMMRVVDAHKGPVRWNVEITGRAAHSSMAHIGVNAVHVAARLLVVLEEIAEDLKTQFHDGRFEPPYPTLQVTRIDGGIATNIVPPSCKFTFDIRALHGLDVDAIESRVRKAADTLLSKMLAVAPEAAISIIRVNQVPPFKADAASEVVALALNLARQNSTSAVSYATEAGLFQNSGAPSVVCGPGDIAQAHTANEWIAESQLIECLAFLGRLAGWQAGQKPEQGCCILTLFSDF